MLGPGRSEKKYIYAFGIFSNICWCCKYNRGAVSDVAISVGILRNYRIKLLLPEGSNGLVNVREA
jgi:hypothetical protein